MTPVRQREGGGDDQQTARIAPPPAAAWNQTDVGRFKGTSYVGDAPNNLCFATSAITVAAGCLILRSAEIA